MNPSRLQPALLRPLEAKPTVSVLIPCYNYAAFVGDAIESVLAQTYRRFEIVVCDDGSTDQTAEIVRRYSRREPQVRLIRQQNAGMNVAVTTALRESSGSVTCLLDADDRYFPHKLHDVVEGFRRHPRAGFLVHRIALTNDRGVVEGVRPLLWDPPSGWYGPVVVQSGEGPPGLVPTVGLCFRREILDQILPLPESPQREWRAGRGWDNAIAALALLTTEVVGLTEVCAEYRLHGGNAVNPAAIDIPYLAQAQHAAELRWRLMHDYLRRRDPAMADSLAPLADQMGYQRSAYMLARLSSRSDWVAVHRSFVRTPRFRRYPLYVRLFWQATRVTPRWLFRWTVEFLWGRGNPVQAMLLRLVQRVRQGRRLDPSI